MLFVLQLNIVLHLEHHISTSKTALFASSITLVRSVTNLHWLNLNARTVPVKLMVEKSSRFQLQITANITCTYLYIQIFNLNLSSAEHIRRLFEKRLSSKWDVKCKWWKNCYFGASSWTFSSSLLGQDLSQYDYVYIHMWQFYDMWESQTKKQPMRPAPKFHSVSNKKN